jgi:hypothetical protein
MTPNNRIAPKIIPRRNSSAPGRIVAAGCRLTRNEDTDSRQGLHGLRGALGDQDIGQGNRKQSENHALCTTGNEDKRG